MQEYATYQFGTDPVGALINDQINESDTLEVRLSHTGDNIVGLLECFTWTPMKTGISPAL
ncbi:MAG: hypothetical protein CM15mP51_00640 [Porticoccaceae bacterium]|nr:MAG: hypothetical protein CM15mP51_00640 [Porticoccaceae bacterium]